MKESRETTCDTKHLIDYFGIELAVGISFLKMSFFECCLRQIKVKLRTVGLG